MNSLAELELQKAALEVEKLRAEVENERLSWWKRPAYIGGMVPIFLAAIAFAGAQTSGWFDLQRDKLNNEVAELASERDNLAGQIDALTQERADLQTEYAVVLERNQALAEENDGIARILVERQAEIDLGYLAVANAIGDLTYGIAHGAAFAYEPDDMEALKARLQTVEEPLRKDLEDFIAVAEHLAWLAKTTFEIGLKSEKVLEQIPASKEMSLSVFDPMLSEIGLRWVDESFEIAIDVTTGELLTKDKVTERLNAQ